MNFGKSFVAKAILALVIAWCVVAANTYADGDKSNGTKRGISAAVQGEQLYILLPHWLNSRVVLTPSFGFVHVSDVANDFQFALAIRQNLKEGEAVPYLGLRFGVLVLHPVGGDDITDYVIGPLAGGEYFLDDHFSLGVEAQVNFTKSDEKSWRFGNPDGLNINTATAAFATFYF